MKVQRALISVHDKTGLVTLARALAALHIEIISTGGTARALRDAGIAALTVADLIGFPEILDGRVKALHPAIHGAILARREVPGDLATLTAHGISPIDLVIVSLYPFEATAARDGVTRAEAVEQIDIGGAAMIRSAAKNHAAVGVVTDPSQYAALVAELEVRGGGLSDSTRAQLAIEAFRRTARYDAAIAHYLAAGASDETLPLSLPIQCELLATLRYGENPHQSAALYGIDGKAAGVAAARQLAGPSVGYNNLLDISAALRLLLEFDSPAAVVVKHTNPCGAAVGDDVADAVAKARACDPISIYGGIFGVNRRIDLAAVAELAGVFLDVLFAPGFDPDALNELRRTRKKCRVLEVPFDTGAVDAPEVRSIIGGLLVQSPDSSCFERLELRVVSQRAPTVQEGEALRFGWRVVKHVKSNAIVLSTADRVIGVGGGQTSRVGAAGLAIERALRGNLAPAGSVCASDAFFPFADGIEVLAAAGVTAVIQSGGSMRDEAVIAAADKHRMAMVFTGVRQLRH